MLSVAGIYIYTFYGNAIDSFDTIHDCIAVSNYYKFSLCLPGKDLNPDKSLGDHMSPEDYWKVNDGLSESELSCLKPSTIISFKGRHNNILKSSSRNGVPLVKTINDPSWILRGASGVLNENGSWYRKTDDKKAVHLVDSYLDQIDGKYSGKKSAIKIYLLKYFDDWMNSSVASTS